MELNFTHVEMIVQFLVRECEVLHNHSKILRFWIDWRVKLLGLDIQSTCLKSSWSITLIIIIIRWFSIQKYEEKERSSMVYLACLNSLVIN